MDYSIFSKYFEVDKLLFNSAMSEYTSFKVGGPADLIITPANIEDVKSALSLCKSKGLPNFVMGKGSNLLVKDSGYKGVIICTSKSLDNIEFLGEGIIRAGAGTTLAKLAGFAADLSLAGLEFASGIPGSLGGAVYMNAGAYDGEMKDVIVSANVIDEGGNAIAMAKADMAFGYRSSVFQKNKHIIFDVTLSLTKGDKESIREKMLDLNGKRKEKQPLDLPSGGSTFKRPEGHFASKLIDDSGLKGYSIGGAMVSPKHAGFIVNYDNATADDIISLIEHVKLTVFNKFGVKLVPEVEIIG